MDEQILTVDQWNDWWKRGYEKSKSKNKSDSGADQQDCCDNPFTQPSEMLKKYIDLLFPSKDLKRIFIPLCGKSPDMKWLLDNVGCEMVGLECSEHAIMSFFEESGIEYEVVEQAQHPDFRIFRGKNANVSIYQGDYFKFSVDAAGGPFDAIWDTASLNTIDLSLRKPYVEVMRSLMKKECCYLLSAMYFGDIRTWKDNPYDISDEDMKDMFGNSYTWKKVDEDKTEWGNERIFLISLK